jgi:hypothetical protein
MANQIDNQNLPITLFSPETDSLIQTTNKTFSGFSYDFALDNIFLGYKSYKSKSIFITKPLNLSNPLQIGLKVLESRTYKATSSSTPQTTETTYDTLDDNYFLNSIEYWVLERDFDSTNNLLRFVKYPILPLNVRRVHHERLYLTEKRLTTDLSFNTGYLNFYAIEGESYSNIKIYKNGNLYIEGKTISTTSDSPNTGLPMKTKIYLASVLPTDIFTVTYTPILSNTSTIPSTFSSYAISKPSLVDLIGDGTVFQTKNQSLLINNNTNNLSSTQIRLSIILRNNTSNLGLTPAIEEYTFSCSERNMGKF